LQPTCGRLPCVPPSAHTFHGRYRERRPLTTLAWRGVNYLGEDLESAATSAPFCKFTDTAGVDGLDWLVEDYARTKPGASLPPATQRQRAGFLRAVTKNGGKHPLRRIDKQAFKSGIRRRKGPNAKRHFLQTRGLFQWAKDGNDHDPTAGLFVERPATDGSSGLNR
jgi:hypothetical protein